MATVPLELRRPFWRNFDRRYVAVHPGLRPMRNSRWELPHWMTWLAGVLVDAGYSNIAVVDGDFVDPSTNGIHRAAWTAALQSTPADVYLFSPMTPNLHLALEIADVVKELQPRCTTVFGGVVATPLHRELPCHDSVDVVVRGRGEYALPQLLDAITSGDGLCNVGQVSFVADNGDLHESEDTYPWMPPHAIPFPKVDLFPPDVGLDLRYLRQVFGLGCPYTCKFCTIQTIGRRPSFFPVDRIVEEIHAYRAQYGARHNVYFGDETFTLVPEQTMILARALERSCDVIYDCQTRLNLLNDVHMLAAMYRSGCRWVEIGVEAVDQSTQNVFKQRVDIRLLEQVLRRLQDCGLAACSFLVNGFPNQTADDMRRSIDLTGGLIESGLLQASYLFGLVPYPGSALFETPDAFGVTVLHHDYSLYHEDLPPVYRTAHCDPDEIYDVFLYGLHILGEAMSHRPQLGVDLTALPAEQFGSFWAGSHV